MNLFYQKNLSLYFIGLLIFGLTLSVNFNVKAQVRDGGINATTNECKFGDDVDEENREQKYYWSILNLKWFNAKYNDQIDLVGGGYYFEDINNENIMFFGLPVNNYADGVFKEKSCFWDGNSNCKKEIKKNNVSSKYVYCMGKGGPQVNSNITSYFIECTNGNLKTEDLYKVKKYKSNILPEYTRNFVVGNGSAVFDLLTVTYSPKLPPNCEICKDSSGKESNKFEDCPSGKATKSTCEFSIDSATKTCKFGQTGTNCASDVSSKIRPTEKIDGKTVTYFCNGDSRVVVCDGNKINTPYSDIFLNDGKYTNLKDKNCKLYQSALDTKCELPNDRNEGCKFGNLTTKLSSSSEAFNCADQNKTYKNRDNETVYCSPSNTKVICKNQVSYYDLFKPIQQGSTEDYLPIYNYANKSISNEQKNNCRPFKDVPTGCNVNKDSVIGDTCQVPIECFSDPNQPVQVTIRKNYQGGLYCISSTTSAIENTGTVHFCGKEQGKLPAYSDISEITSKNGVNNVYFLADNNRWRNCLATPDIQLDQRLVDPLSPIYLIRTISSTLYYFAIFYFIVLILINAFSYVRSGEDPAKLKQISESLFNTIAGFIFVLASGGVIVYLLSQFK